ncbi:Endoplasmic reticulum-Golgi intermediate compartment protein 3 [Gryllus bimaculatus]|nr:Endoplasmic reticulum-Golgi intermediate compartment protein 3 [Gryllus bimaculatus]
MSVNDILDTLRRFDAYPKTQEDIRIKTFGGATVLVLDAMDSSGEQHLQIEHNIYKRRLDLLGNPIEEPQKEDLGAVSEIVQKDVNKTQECGSCYGAETEDLPYVTICGNQLVGNLRELQSSLCCSTCEDVKDAYRRKKWAFPDLQSIKQCQSENYSEKLKSAFTEACQIYGYMEVNRVGGSFHIAPGKSFSINHVHVHDVQPFSSSSFNTSHRIRHLSFGKNIPGKTNPIDGTEVIAHEGATMFQYYVKIVPTTYHRKDGAVFYTNQFSVTRHQKILWTFRHKCVCYHWRSLHSCWAH